MKPMVIPFETIEEFMRRLSILESSCTEMGKIIQHISTERVLQEQDNEVIK
jgi:hypothetical protein